MNKTYSTIIIGILFVIQLILVVSIYSQNMISWEGQSRVGIFVASILLILAIQLILYDKSYGFGKDKYIEKKVEEEH
jgi:hypothetical protein